MTKVTKVYLISEQIDKDGNKIDFKKISELLWNLQMQTRDIKNKCVQLCWEWLNFSSDYYKKSEEYPKEKLNLCYSFNNHVISTLDTEKIMGVDLGVVYPIMASVNGDYARFSIKGGEIEAFRSRVEARRRSLLNLLPNGKR